MKKKLARAKTRIPPARGCQRRVGVCPCVPSLRERASCRDSSCARALTRTGASTASHAGKFACTCASFACIRRCSCRLSSVTCNLSRPLYHVTPSPRPLFYLTPSPRDCLPLSAPLSPSLSGSPAPPPPLPPTLPLSHRMMRIVLIIRQLRITDKIRKVFRGDPVRQGWQVFSVERSRSGPRLESGLHHGKIGGRATKLNESELSDGAYRLFQGV